MGAGLRYIHSHLAPYHLVFLGEVMESGDGKANGLAFDLATLYRLPFAPRFSIGANLSNMGPKISYTDDKEQADPLPTNLRLGLACKVLDSEANRLTIAADMNKLMVNRNMDGTSDNFFKALSTSPWTIKEWHASEEMDTTYYRTIFNGIVCGGMEYRALNSIAMRMGYYWNRPGKVQYWTFGAGIIFPYGQVDLSYIAAEVGHPLDNTIRASLTLTPDYCADTFSWSRQMNKPVSAFSANLGRMNMVHGGLHDFHQDNANLTLQFVQRAKSLFAVDFSASYAPLRVNESAYDEWINRYGNDVKLVESSKGGALFSFGSAVRMTWAIAGDNYTYLKLGPIFSWFDSNLKARLVSYYPGSQRIYQDIKIEVARPPFMYGFQAGIGSSIALKNGSSVEIAVTCKSLNKNDVTAVWIEPSIGYKLALSR